MRRLVVLLALLVCLIPVTVQAENDPFNVNSSLFWADFPSSDGGIGYVDIYVQNTQRVSQTITVSPWIQYTYPDAEATGGWIKPEWIPSITPNELLLSPSQSALFSVCFQLPADAPEKVFKTWIKVSNGEVNKPITVWVRKGAAVPTYSFGLTAGSGAYLCKVKGYGAEAVIDNPLNETVGPIGIRSKCSATTKFQAVIEEPAEVDEVTGEVRHNDAITQARVDDSRSAIFYGKQEEVGNVYQGLDVDTASEWLKIGDDRTPCTLANPLIVEPYATAYIPWSLTIPDDVPNGCYWVWVHIKAAGPTNVGATGIGIDYMSKIYIEINRSHGPSWSLGLIIIGIGGGLLVLLFISRRVQDIWSQRKAKHATLNGHSRKSVPA